MKHELIYADRNKLYFGDKETAWGDDWDDVPYEHNAGEPYDYTIVMLWDSQFDWQVAMPCTNFANSPWSVKDINRGVCAWVIHPDFTFPAGTMFQEVVHTFVEHDVMFDYRVKKKEEENNG